MPTWARWIVDRAVQWWWLDLPVAGLGVILIAARVRPGTGVDLLGQLDLETRRAIYTDLMQIAALFAGFSGVIFAVYLGLSSRGVRQVKDMVGKQLLTMWLFALTVPWVAALLLILAKVLDRGEMASPNVARWLAVAAVVLVAIELLRILWIFYQIAVIDLRGVQPARPIRTRPIELTRKHA
jgi:hypothetical protein